MSILTQLLHGEITWSQAASKAESWASALTAKDPALAAAAGAILSAVKQGASNAIMVADTELAAHIGDAATAVEAALDAALIKATGGLAVPFVPIINTGIDQIAGAVKAAADAWALEQKAKLAGQPAP